MLIEHQSHLSYCTNIHEGETWEATFKNLKQYTLDVKCNMSPNKLFGIGLRLSQKSAKTLLEADNLSKFKIWLDNNNMYVFTINGFPFGDFHNTIIKDKVHVPDWTTSERLEYTKDLMHILAHLLPEGMDGGVSTSPLSYKYWFENDSDKIKVKEKASNALIDIVLQLVDIKNSKGKLLHLDLEPEPDGFLENTKEVLEFYNTFLFSSGTKRVQNELKCSYDEAKVHIQDHIQICYDVCHFALAYERPKFVINALQKAGIKIGKIQISAALKCKKSIKTTIKEQQECLKQFDESTYLHQSVVKLNDDKLVHFSDLAEGITLMDHPNFEEIRTHFHVPVFISEFQVLESTQNEIEDALTLWKTSKFTNHLEVETYTWGILPEHLQTDITSSIVRELDWVIKALAT